jgi:hypothetical protein
MLVTWFLHSRFPIVVRFLEDCLYVLGVSLELELEIKASYVTLRLVANVIFLSSHITLSRISTPLVV